MILPNAFVPIFPIIFEKVTAKCEAGDYNFFRHLDCATIVTLCTRRPRIVAYTKLTLISLKKVTNIIKQKKSYRLFYSTRSQHTRLRLWK